MKNYTALMTVIFRRYCSSGNKLNWYNKIGMELNPPHKLSVESQHEIRTHDRLIFAGLTESVMLHISEAQSLGKLSTISL